MALRALALIIGLAAAAAATSIHAAVPPADVRDKVQVERYIRECENEWVQFSVTRDPEPIAAFMAADFQGVSAGAQVMGRSAALKVETGPNEVASDTIDRMDVQFPSPELAIARGQDTTVMKNGDRFRRVWTDIWLLRNGRWRLIASHDSPL